MTSARSHSEAGFTLVEVMVAALILVIGLLGVFVSLDAASHLDTTSRRQQVALTQAEQAMEQLKAVPYAQLALSSAPSHANDTSTGKVPSVPNYWVSTSGGKLIIPGDFNDKTSGTLSGTPAAGEPLITGGSAAPSTRCASGQACAPVDGLDFTVYRYVTQEDECTQLLSLCNISLLQSLLNQYAKRVTVAVVVDGGPGVGATKPVWLSTVVANPNSGVVNLL
jgi:prepilin-type N-terminal cleavage/methylation domain-containing protein